MFARFTWEAKDIKGGLMAKKEHGAGVVVGFMNRNDSRGNLFYVMGLNDGNTWTYDQTAEDISAFFTHHNMEPLK